jgi:uncharacterized protein YgiM (DUF1202 family)
MKAISLLLIMGLILLSSCSPLDAYAVTAVTAAPSPTIASSPPPATAVRADTCQVRTGIPDGSLNLRAGAGMRYAVIEVLEEGQVLTVLARGAWLRVRTRGDLTGFVNAKFCR